MSQIFDALQKSESGDATRALEATELLLRAERRATSKWETAVVAEKPGITTPKTDSAPEAMKGQAIGDFGQVRSLEVAPTPQGRVVCLTDSDSPAAEAFRLLGVRLRHMRRERPLQRILITSTIPQEGKSMVAVNLACALALKTEQKVLLIEGDLRRPSLSQTLGIGKNPGLCECLEMHRAPVGCLYYLEGTKVWMLPAGSSSSNALDLLQSGRFTALMDQLSAWFDWIVIDAPPVLPLADTSVWERIADGVLLVARPGVTKKRQLLRGLEAVESKKLIGALLNCSRHSEHGDYDYYYRGPASAERAGSGPANSVPPNIG